MKQRILVADQRTAAERPPSNATGDPGRAWNVALWFGALLVLIGWTDLLLIWYPPQWGSPEWEFGTISTAVNAVPLGTIGLVAVIAAGTALGRRRLLLAAGLFAWAGAVFLAVLGTIYLLVVPIALRGTPAVAATAVKVAIVKTSFFLLLYVATYALLGFFAVRRPKQRRGS